MNDANKDLIKKLVELAYREGQLNGENKKKISFRSSRSYQSFLKLMKSSIFKN